MDTNDNSECGNEDDEMMTEINNDNNLTISLNQKSTPNDAYEVNYLKHILLNKNHYFNFFIKTCF